MGEGIHLQLWDGRGLGSKPLRIRMTLVTVLNVRNTLKDCCIHRFMMCQCIIASDFLNLTLILPATMKPNQSITIYSLSNNTKLLRI